MFICFLLSNTSLCITLIIFFFEIFIHIYIVSWSYQPLSLSLSYLPFIKFPLSLIGAGHLWGYPVEIEIYSSHSPEKNDSLSLSSLNCQYLLSYSRHLWTLPLSMLEGWLVVCDGLVHATRTDNSSWVLFPDMSRGHSSSF